MADRKPFGSFAPNDKYNQPLYPGGRPMAWFDDVPPVAYGGTGMEAQFNPDVLAARAQWDSRSWRPPNTGALHHQSQMYDPLTGAPLYPAQPNFVWGVGDFSVPRANPPPNWRDLKPDWYPDDRPGPLQPYPSTALNPG